MIGRLLGTLMLLFLLMIAIMHAAVWLLDNNQFWGIVGY
jgi:hypothetical protein